MTKRSVTDIGLINIGRQIRGEALDRDVFLSLADAGIIISPRNPGEAADDDMVYETKFDQYNRINLPSKLRRAANIRKRVDIVRDGDRLILSPATDVCVICGTEENLREVSHDKYICEACRKIMIRTKRTGREQL